MKRQLGVIAGCTTISCVAVAWALVVQSPGPPAVGEIPTPRHWVPFEADVSESVNGQPVAAGRYHRASDGSIREDMSLADGTHRIGIVNLSRRVVYMYDGTGWLSMQTTATADATPPRYRHGMTGLTRAPEAYEGLDAYVLHLKTGERQVRIPALNFAAVRVENPASGSLRVLNHLKIGEPDPALFLPPAGQPVRALPGIMDPMARGAEAAAQARR